MSLKRPGVGVGVIITSPHHPDCVLLGKRKGNVFGSSLYSLPGGHLEFGEEWIDCAKRETMEETGLTLTNLQFVAACNSVDLSMDYHYIELIIRGEVDLSVRAEPVNMEPHKCEGWEWRKPDEFPSFDQIFPGLRTLIEDKIPPFHLVKC